MEITDQGLFFKIPISDPYPIPFSRILTWMLWSRAPVTCTFSKPSCWKPGLRTTAVDLFPWSAKWEFPAWSSLKIEGRREGLPAWFSDLNKCWPCGCGITHSSSFLPQRPWDSRVSAKPSAWHGWEGQFEKRPGSQVVGRLLFWSHVFLGHGAERQMEEQAEKWGFPRQVESCVFGKSESPEVSQQAGR